MADTESDTSTATDRRSTSERATPIIIGLLGLVGLASFALAVTAGGGGGSGSGGRLEVTGGTNPIERIFPENGDEVLQQATVGLDLDAAWEADLIINGILIPPSQLAANAATGTYSFTPDAGQVIERLDADENCAVGVMRLIRDPTQTATARWCFTAL